MVPQYAAKFPMEKFKAWLDANPNTLWQEPKSRWELVRFLGNGGTYIIHQNAKGHLTYSHGAQAFVEEFQLCQG